MIPGPRRFALAAKLFIGLRLKISPARLANELLSNDLISPAQVPSELRRLAEIVAELRPRKVMEIGTFRGGTLCMFARLADITADLISVDLPGGEFGGGYKGFRTTLYRCFGKLFQRMTFIRADSHAHSTIRRVKEITQSLDLLFIDGDHTYEGVKADFLNYSPIVRSGGIVAFHDIAEHPRETGCEVDRFWDEIKTKYRYEEIIEDPKQGWAGIGVLYV